MKSIVKIVIAIKENKMENYEKKYKEALEWMKKLYPTMTGAIKEDAEHHFPELKEPEDEQIRKHLITYFRHKTKQEWNGMPVKNIIAWLEKRDEQKQIRQQCADFYNKDSGLQMPRLTAFENELANILFDREYDGSTETEDDIQRGKLEYEIAAIGLAPKLQSLINIEQKPIEWSEEEHQILSDAAWTIVNFSDTVETKAEKEKLSELSNKLLDLRPPKQWKPSDDQIKALKNTISIKPFENPSDNLLWELYEQLKKLREE